jgi:hypothetical protein
LGIQNDDFTDTAEIELEPEISDSDFDDSHPISLAWEIVP